MENQNDAKGLIEKLGQDWQEFRKTNDEILKGKAEGKSVTDLDAKLVKIETAMDATQKRLADLDELEKKLNRPDFGTQKDRDIEAEVKQFNAQRKSFDVSSAATPITADEFRNYVSGFWKLQARGNMEALSDSERKAMIAGDDSNGGYLLPPATIGKVVAKLFELSPIRAIAAVQPISTDALEGLYDNDESSYGWVAETAARTDTTTPTVGKYRIECAEMYAAPKASQKLLDDSMVDIENWLAMKVADKFARVEGAAFITGTGSGQPRGFASYTMATTADATRAWGQIEQVKTGNAADFASLNPGDKIFDLIQAFKGAYLQNAKWVTTREVIGKIRKFKEATTNAYMWQPGLAKGTPDTLLGYPIVMAQDVTALASGSLSLWLADWQQFYQIVDRFGVRTLRDPFTSKPYVIFYSTKRVGGGVLNYEAGKAMYFGT